MKRQLATWGGAGIILLLLSIVLSISLGSATLPLSHTWQILCYHIPGLKLMIDPQWAVSSEQIIMKVRFPRIVLAMLVGACLSIAGTGFQGVLRNPLADPFTLGVASGASVGAAFIILFNLQYILFGQWTIPLISFITAMLSLIAVLKLASAQGKLQVETVILAGVVIQAFLGAAVSFMVAISQDALNDIVFWMMGSLKMRGWSFSLTILPYFLLGTIVLLGYGRTLNLFALGERRAAHLGVHVERTKWIILIVATLIAAAAVSVSGVIGFVGLIIPHLLRLLVGPDYRLILPLSIIYGALYVLWADTIARLVISPLEIPLGVVTAFLGAPFFAYLLNKHKKTQGDASVN